VCGFPLGGVEVGAGSRLSVRMCRLAAQGGHFELGLGAGMSVGCVPHVPPLGSETKTI